MAGDEGDTTPTGELYRFCEFLGIAKPRRWSPQYVAVTPTSLGAGCDQAPAPKRPFAEIDLEAITRPRAPRSRKQGSLDS
jgi:hypothetical protein